MRILIADDSAVDRIMLRRVIEGLGHECLLASTGKEAWELYQAQGADVLISDWMMPGLYGPELCRRIRSQPGAPYTYVILLTVLDDHEHTRHGMQAGADDYLRKPLQIHELELRLINAERVVTLHRRLSRREEQREQTLERHESLLRLAERVVAETDAEELLSVLLSEATDLTGGSAGEISLWDEPASSLVPVRSSLGSTGAVTSAARSAARRAAQRQAPLILDDPQLGAAPGQTRIGAMATPLVHDDRLLGALAVVSGTHQFTPGDADVLHRLATIGAAGLVSLSRGRGSGDPIAADQANETPSRRPPANLPPVPTSLIGREAELDQLEAELRRVGSALVTLTGPAGVGKTRLALALAARVARWLADGVFFVDLAPLRDPDAVITAIGQALRAPAPSGIEDVQLAIGERQLLLVMDNFEHLLPAAAVVRQLLAACPSVKVLVTSRASLRLRGEQLYPVRPLAVPPLDESLSVEAAQRSPAVALFLERARAVQPGFALTDANAASVATICARLDGLPLAIELAAARSSVLAPDAMVSRLEYPLRLLTGAEQDRPARHQTLRDAIAWSYALLRPDEQRAFRQLGVFAGDFSFEAAAALWSGVAPDEQREVLDTIGGLLDNSLLYRHSPMTEAPRFRLLETIRQYALEQLEASGELEEARRCHAVFFLGVAEQAAPELRGPDQSVWLDRLDREHANLQAALGYVWETGSAELTMRFTAALVDFWEIRAFLADGETWLERARDLGASWTGSARARVLSGSTRLVLARGDRPGAVELAEASVSAWRELDDRNRLAEALADLALARTARAVKSREPRELARESESLARSGQHAGTLAHVTHRLGEIAFGQGWFAGAQALFRESALLALRAGDQWRAAAGLEGLAVVATAQRRSELALRLAGAAAVLRERLRAPLPPGLLALFDRRLSAARAELGDEAVALAWEEGRVLPVEELIGGFEDTSSPSVAPERAASAESRKLTPREREVAALVALGLRNYDIAQQLGISRKTAEVHVANVLDKLGMTSRVQLASWALREGLLQQAQS